MSSTRVAANPSRAKTVAAAPTVPALPRRERSEALTAMVHTPRTPECAAILGTNRLTFESRDTWRMQRMMFDAKRRALYEKFAPGSPLYLDAHYLVADVDRDPRRTQ